MNNRILYQEVYHEWEEFARHRNLDLNISRKSDTFGGGILKYVEFAVTNKENTIKMYQYFIQCDSWLDYIETPKFLTLEYEEDLKKNIKVSMWRKGVLEKLFLRNRIKTNNKQFNTTFSIKSVPEKLGAKIFNDKNIQSLFIQNIFLVFNVLSEKGVVKIQLKNVATKYHNIESLENHFDNFILLIDRTISD